MDKFPSVSADYHSLHFSIEQNYRGAIIIKVILILILVYVQHLAGVAIELLKNSSFHAIVVKLCF